MDAMTLDPGGSFCPLTPQAITAIRAVNLMARVRGKPVVLWPVFVMALHSATVRQGGVKMGGGSMSDPKPLQKTRRPCPTCGGPTYNASSPRSTIQYDHCYKCQVTWSHPK